MRKKEPLSILLNSNVEEKIYTASLGYSFGSKVEMSLGLGRGAVDLEQDFTNDFILANDVFLYGGRAEQLEVKLDTRIFVGNSFSFLFSAIGSRSTHQLGIFDTTYLWYLESTRKADTILGSIGIGNQWAFDSGLILGLDWAIYSRPVVSKDSVSYVSSGLGENQISNLNVALTDWLNRIAEPKDIISYAINIGFRF